MVGSLKVLQWNQIIDWLLFIPLELGFSAKITLWVICLSVLGVGLAEMRLIPWKALQDDIKQ